MTKRNDSKAYQQHVTTKCGGFIPMHMKLSTGNSSDLMFMWGGSRLPSDPSCRSNPFSLPLTLLLHSTLSHQHYAPDLKGFKVACLLARHICWPSLPSYCHKLLYPQLVFDFRWCNHRTYVPGCVCNATLQRTTSRNLQCVCNTRAAGTVTIQSEGLHVCSEFDRSQQMAWPKDDSQSTESLLDLFKCHWLQW